MSCNGNCTCGKNDVTAAVDKCPCGKMAAAECNCGGKNVAAAAEGDAPSGEEVEQPKLPVESHNELLAGMARGVEELSTRMSGIEELLAQIIAAKMAENLAD